MEFLSPNAYMTGAVTGRATLPAIAEDEASAAEAPALRFEWHSRNGCIDLAQLPAFRDFLDQLGSC